MNSDLSRPAWSAAKPRSETDRSVNAKETTVRSVLEIGVGWVGVMGSVRVMGSYLLLSDLLTGHEPARRRFSTEVWRTQRKPTLRPPNLCAECFRFTGSFLNPS